jgi:hypothetical protein
MVYDQKSTESIGNPSRASSLKIPPESVPFVDGLASPFPERGRGGCDGHLGSSKAELDHGEGGFELMFESASSWRTLVRRPW